MAELLSDLEWQEVSELLQMSDFDDVASARHPTVVQHSGTGWLRRYRTRISALLLLLLLATIYLLLGDQNRPSEFSTDNDDKRRSVITGQSYWQSQQSTRRLSCMWNIGGIGNRLFQYASTFGLSNPHNVSIILGVNDEIYKSFTVPSATVFPDMSLCETFVTVMEDICCSFDSNLIQENPPINYNFLRYLQSWKYFANVSDGLRTELTFRPFVQRPAKEIVENYRQAYALERSPTTVVGVHIRRGDILETNYREYGYNTAPVTYILKAIEYFVTRFNNVVFIVCSNDLEYSRKVLNGRNIIVNYAFVSAIFDLAILSSCDHVITTVGSFGWWAGYLSKGAVLYYKYPHRAGSKAAEQYNYADLFPPNWIGLE